MFVLLEREHTLYVPGWEQTRELLFDLSSRSDRLILDFSRTASFDGAFVGLLCVIWGRLGRRKERFAVCGLNAFLMSLLQTCGLQKVWSIYPTGQEALNAP
jgi:anti-anti-sigma regulatory factor